MIKQDMKEAEKLIDAKAPIDLMACVRFNLDGSAFKIKLEGPDHKDCDEKNCPACKAISIFEEAWDRLYYLLTTKDETPHPKNIKEWRRAWRAEGLL